MGRHAFINLQVGFVLILKEHRTLEIIPPPDLFPNNGEMPLVFKTPTPSDLAVLANRLLRFKLPIEKNYAALERFISRHLLTPKIPGKILQNLPLPLLEEWTEVLWGAAFEKQYNLENQMLSLLMLIEEALQFQPAKLVGSDIQHMGLHDSGRLHSYFYQGQLNYETLKAVLDQSRYMTDYLQPQDSKRHQLMGYLAGRVLTRPMRWMELLDALDEEHLFLFPALARLKDMADWVKPQRQEIAKRLLPQEFRNTLVYLCQHIWAVSSALGQKYMLPRPVRILVIVEGSTEEILLPRFAQTMNVDFNQSGVYILPAGGKNQVGQLYHTYADILRIPIFILLDQDAQTTPAALTLREQDTVYCLKEGEFEDTYDLNLVMETINRYYHPISPLKQEEYQQIHENLALEGNDTGRVSVLRALFRIYELGEFDKVDFAEKLSATLSLSVPPSPALKHLITSIMALGHETLAL